MVDVVEGVAMTVDEDVMEDLVEDVEEDVRFFGIVVFTLREEKMIIFKRAVRFNFEINFCFSAKKVLKTEINLKNGRKTNEKIIFVTFKREMGNAKLHIHKKNKHGKIDTYSYDKIGGIDLSKYMGEKVKQRRRMKRMEQGKILANEVPAFLIEEMRHEREEFNTPYAQLARKHGLSRYLVKKVIHVCPQNDEIFAEMNDEIKMR